MESIKLGAFYVHRCTNPECNGEYFSHDLEGGRCPSCKNGKKSRRLFKAPVSKPSDPDYDQVLFQAELLPVSNKLAIKMGHENEHVKELTRELGFFDGLYEEITELVKAMPKDMRVTTRVLRKIKEIPSGERGMIIFVNKALKRCAREGLLKMVGNQGKSIVYQKVVPPADESIAELQETLEGT